LTSWGRPLEPLADETPSHQNNPASHLHFGKVSASTVSVPVALIVTVVVLLLSFVVVVVVVVFVVVVESCRQPLFSLLQILPWPTPNATPP
jgi:uncharacterized membrane protein